MKRILFAALLISLTGLLNLSAQQRIYTPQLSLPENNAVDQMPDVVLDWDGVTGGNTGIIQYDIQLDSDPAFPNPTIFQTEFVTAVKASNLLFGGTYYWHVRAKDGTDVSPWSETRAFRVIRRVVLTGPNDASTTNDTVKLVWKSISGLQKYDYQLDTVYFWKSYSSGFSFNQSSIKVLDDTHAWIIGAGGRIIFYDGTSWTQQASNTTKDLKGISFLDANNGWAAGLESTILHFNGTEWSSQTADSTRDIYSISMYDPTHGWAVGKGGAKFYLANDHWVYVKDTIHLQNLNAVVALDANHVWAGGKLGMLLFYNGTEWTQLSLGASFAKEIKSMYFNSVDDGWATCTSGVILRWQSGEWSIYNNGTLTTKDLLGMTFLDPGNGYAVGKTGTLLYYDGTDWSSQSSTTTTNLNAVSFYGDLGFLVGDNGVIINYNTEAFSSPLAVIHQVAGDQSSVRVNFLLFGTQYYWRMRAIHSQATSEWSGARSFNTRATVTQDKPSDADTNDFLDVALQWKSQFSSEVTYEVQIDDDQAFGSPVNISTEDISVNAQMLKFGTTYYWRARALHAFDVSDWCDSWSFTTINKVDLISPVDGETNVKISPLLTWTAQTGITGFQVMVADNSSFTNPVANGIVADTENIYIVPVVLNKDALYYWRCRAVNGLDTSGWSPVWSFRTLPPVGINEPGLESLLSIYPNPINNTVYIQLKESQAIRLNITISDLVGMKVVERKIALDAGSKIIPMDLSDLKEGIYLMRIEDKDRSYTKKIIIKR